MDGGHEKALNKLAPFRAAPGHVVEPDIKESNPNGGGNANTASGKHWTLQAECFRFFSLETPCIIGQLFSEERSEKRQKKSPEMGEQDIAVVI